MALIPFAPPDDVAGDVADFVQASWGTLIADPIQREKFPTKIELVAPHRIFALSGKWHRQHEIADAIFVGWRFLLAVNDTTVASIERFNDSPNAPTINSGPFVSATANLIPQLDTMINSLD